MGLRRHSRSRQPASRFPESCSPRCISSRSPTLEGIEYYLARLEEKDVCTAIGYTVDDTVGIFNVATPPEFRRRGYGSIITAYAVQAGFDAGADFAYLQSSAMGESVYRRLGFRHVSTYTVLVRRPEVSATS